MYIASLQLENVRAFNDLHFEFKRPDDTYAGWTVFLGGNSSGKSTLLKSLALPLLGPDDGRQLIGSGQGWISHGKTKGEAKVMVVRDTTLDLGKGAKGTLPAIFEAGVRLNVESAETNAYASLKPIENRKTTATTRVPANRGLWNRNAPGWFSAGYGPMRRLSGNSSESMRYAADRGPVGRYVTLFREDAALSESEDWLRTNHSRTLEGNQPALAALLDSVKELLGDGLLPYGMKIDRITVDHVFVKDSRGTELPMRDISDGCRSVYATVLDIVHGLYDVYGYEGLFKRNTAGSIYIDRPGVVLIDEIEAHLHPSWQRDIPYWLKEHFPRVQFLVTTHSPLVAQAADKNGIFVLPSLTDTSRKPRPLTNEEYQRVRWGKAEKTLLGTAFGLDSTRSNWANQQIERWRKLSAKKSAIGNLVASEEAELNTLKGQLEIALEPTSELIG
jgi:predicted ATPase